MHLRVRPHWTFPHPDLTFYYNTLLIHIWKGGNQCHSQTRAGCVQGEGTADKLRTAFSAGQSTELLTQSNGSLARSCFFPSCHLPSYSSFRATKSISDFIAWVNLFCFEFGGSGAWKGEAKFFYHYYRECLLLSTPAAVFVGAAALLKSWEKKEQQATSVRVQFLLLYSSARLQLSGQSQPFHDNCGGMILFQIKKLHENLL